MVFFVKGIVEMEVAESVSVLKNDRFIRPADAVVVANIEGQRKHRALQQKGYGPLLKRSISAAVFPSLAHTH